jgi:hypothetical protein
MDARYLTDIPYTNKFYSELNPHLISYISRLHGFTQCDMQMPFTYCELGCGSGFSLLTFAAANPDAHFIGIDFNPDHIAEAEQLSRRSGVDNITWICKSFEELDEHDIPPCNFITMHGVYSWVSPEMQDIIRRVISTSLLPGGLAMISYNCYPGWHAYAPVREMLREYAFGLSDDLLADARTGIEYLRFLKDSGSIYFQAVPGAGKLLEDLEKQDLHYVVHEYFTPYWQPLWFRQMYESMLDSGLHFTGSLPLYMNYGEVCLNEGVQDFMSTAPDRLTFEIHKDFIRNTMFRWDIYRKEDGNPRQAVSEFHHFADQNFGLLLRHSEVSLQVSLPGCRNLNLEPELYGGIIDAMSGGAATLRQITLHPHCNSLDPENIAPAIHYLCMSEQARPFRFSSPAFPYEQQWQKASLSKHNKAVIESSLQQDYCTLASTITGSGYTVNRDTALFLLATSLHGIQDAPEWIADWMELHGYGISGQLLPKVHEQYALFAGNIAFWHQIGLIEVF